jgi:hypothetical protein
MEDNDAIAEPQRQARDDAQFWKRVLCVAIVCVVVLTIPPAALIVTI